MPATRLVLCADDYALTPAVSRGILMLVRQGRLSAVGCMTNRPAWPDDAPALIGQHEAAPESFSVGLHLNLTLGAALGPMPKLTPRGRLPPLRRLTRRAFLGRLDRAEIAAEIGRQIDVFIERAGRDPDFIDGHQHVHVLPTVRAALFDVLEARGFAGRLWLRDPSERIAAIARRGVATGKALAIAVLSAGFGRDARRRGFAVNRGFAGVSPFDPARDFGADMARFVSMPGLAPLVMCHPGEVDEELERLDPVVGTRPQELAYLASDAFADLLRERQITLVPAP